jgi:hypothetical protein
LYDQQYHHSRILSGPVSVLPDPYILDTTMRTFLTLLCVYRPLDTVEGELGVASLLVNYFKRGPFPDTCGCAPLPGCTPKVPLSSQSGAILAYSTLHTQVYKV